MKNTQRQSTILTQALDKHAFFKPPMQLQGQEKNHPHTGLQKEWLLCNENEQN